MITRWIPVLLLMLVALTALSAVDAVAVQVGDTAPDFTLLDPDGQSYTLSAYRGKVVVLAFIGYG